MNVAGDGLSGVLGAVVAQLIVLSQYKEPLPPHLALLYQPACAKIIVCGGGGGGGEYGKDEGRNYSMSKQLRKMCPLFVQYSHS